MSDPLIIEEIRETVADGSGCYRECEKPASTGWCSCRNEAEVIINRLRGYFADNPVNPLTPEAAAAAQEYERYRLLCSLVKQASLYLSRDSVRVHMSHNVFLIDTGGGDVVSIETNTTNFNLACSRGIQTALRQLVESRRRELCKEFFPE